METRTLRVNVTQKDIDQGCRNSSSNCPIARAITRLTKAHSVCVGETTFEFRSPVVNSNSYFTSGHLPVAASKFISRFDKNYPVTPLRFRIKIRMPQA